MSEQSVNNEDVAAAATVELMDPDLLGHKIIINKTLLSGLDPKERRYQEGVEREIAMVAKVFSRLPEEDLDELSDALGRLHTWETHNAERADVTNNLQAAAEWAKFTKR